jgi:hypothetical protein
VRRLQCIPWEAATGLRWAELLATLRAGGRAMPIKDSLIASTALAHDLAATDATSTPQAWLSSIRSQALVTDTWVRSNVAPATYPRPKRCVGSIFTAGG